jgi:UDP-3-O-[3-hydroxymyristoyl] glucosamine N-acyltransferase
METAHRHVSFPATELAPWLQTPLPKALAAKTITGFASLRDACTGDLSFLSHARHRRQLSATRASFVLLPLGWTVVPAGVLALPVTDPSAVFQQILERFTQPRASVRSGVHPTAMLEDGVQADYSRVSIGANAVVESGAVLEDYVEIGAGCYVGAGVRLGSGTRLFPNVTVLENCAIGRNVIIHSGAVIGADGFGFEFVNGRHRKIRQLGIVQIDDDVEIGANTTVDRARFGRTWIGEGTKIDNQVQIAHNVIIGKHCIVVAGVGIAGSAEIGDYVVIAAQAGIAGHVSVGSQCTIGARSGVTKDLPPRSGQYLGFPAGPAPEVRRQIAAGRQVPELIQRIRALEKGEHP